jgi:hypothetical protein
VSEAFLGVEMPELKEIESVRKELEKKSQMERYMELQRRYEQVEGFIENWEETIELYCQDEKKIFGDQS